MQRIMIFGGSGSGKSTLARQVGAITGLPVVHFDPIYWMPGWVPRPSADIMRLAVEAADRPQWVIDGNHSRSIEHRANRADLIIYLDMPLPLRLWRFTKRRVQYHGRSRPDMAQGCNERWDYGFVRDFIWRYARDKRPDALARMETWQSQGKNTAHLQSRRDVREFLATL